MSARKLLLLLCFLEKRESDGKDLTFVRYMECAVLSGKIHEALKCVCLHRASLRSGEGNHDVRRRGAGKKLVASDE